MLIFSDIFSNNLLVELSRDPEMNNHAINLIERYQPLYKPIYILGPVELGNLKLYIETNLANNFIKPF